MVGKFVNCSGKCINVMGDVMHEEIDKCTISSRQYLSVVVSPSTCIKIFGTLALPIAEKQLLESVH